MEQNTEAKAAPAVEAAPSKKGKRAKVTGKKRTAGRKSAKAARKPKASGGSKRDLIIALISRKGGATLTEIMKAAGWQKHSVRGFSSILGKEMKIDSERKGEDRVYRAR